jgi:hypothetical protein
MSRWRQLTLVSLLDNARLALRFPRTGLNMKPGGNQRDTTGENIEVLYSSSTTTPSE